METTYDSLTAEERRQLDPNAFVCCPNCQHNFEPVFGEEIKRGNWRLGKDVTYFKGNYVKLTPTQHRLLFFLAQSLTTVSVMRLGHKTSRLSTLDPFGSVCVQMHRIRTKLKSLDIPFPIARPHGNGYLWVDLA